MTVRRMMIKSVIVAVLLLEVLGQRTTREVQPAEPTPREAFTEWGYGDCVEDELGVVMNQSLTCLHGEDPALTDVRTWVGLAQLWDVVPEDSPAWHCGWMGDRRC